MELQITPGVVYQYAKYKLGASFLYKKSKEEVDYQNVGMHVTYPYFAAYPLGFFKTIPRGEESTWYYAGKEMGGGLQLDFTADALQLFQQISAGIASQAVVSNRILNRGEGETDVWRADYTSKLGWIRRQDKHEISLVAAFRQAKSYDNLQRQNMNGFWESYGRVARSEHRGADCALTYGFYRQRDAWSNHFSVFAGVRYHQEESVLLFYPVVFSQPIHRFTIHATATRQWVLPGGLLDLSVGSEYGTGGGALQEEKSLSGQTVPDIPLWQNRELLQQLFAYETAVRLNLGTSVCYTRFIPASQFAWFIRVSGRYEQGDKSLSDQNKSGISASVGLLF